MTEPVAPVDWARQQQAEREQAVRRSIDTITQAALNQLHADADRSEEVIGELNEANIQLAKKSARAEQRAEIAEAVARDLDGATNVAVRAIQLMNEAGSERDAAVLRAERAEAAIERVRAELDAIEAEAQVMNPYDRDPVAELGRIRAALTQPDEPQP